MGGVGYDPTFSILVTNIRLMKCASIPTEKNNLLKESMYKIALKPAFLNSKKISVHNRLRSCVSGFSDQRSHQTCSMNIKKLSDLGQICRLIARKQFLILREFSALGEFRNLDPRIKSSVLYPLSYERDL